MDEGRSLAVVLLAAGLGTRMRSARAKVLHEIGGEPMIVYPLRAAAALRPARVAVVVGHQAEAVAAAARVAAAIPDLRIVHQAEQRGTGHAVRCARETFRDWDGDVVILYGDVPCIRAETLRALVAAHRRAGAGLTLCTLRFADPTGYGRIVRDETGRVRRIVEHRDCTPEELAIDEVNPGVYCVQAPLLDAALDRLEADNAQGELYLTDIVALIGATHPIESVAVRDPDELSGINTRQELARMEARTRAAAVERWMEAGVTFEDPATAYVGPDVEIGRDTVIGPNVILRGRTRIGEGCRVDGTAHLTDATLGARVHLRFACVLEGATVGDDAVVGPFARLRPGTALGPRVRIGNFVETKQAAVGAGTKANHLSYLGDCEIGPETNVGAGTITCNYDGIEKHRTRIGARVQIGSDTQLVAPVAVGDDAYVGAGTTVTKDVPPGALAVSRTPMRIVDGWVARFRARKRSR